MRRWVKLFTEILDDPKMAALSDREYRVFVNLLALAGQVDRDGELGTLKEIAYRLRMPPSKFLRILSGLCRKGIEIVSSQTEIYTISAFSLRNPGGASDTPEQVKNRVAKHRAHKQAISENVTPLQPEPCNGDVTALLDKNREEENREGATAPSTSPDPKVEKASKPSPAVETFRDVRHKYPAKETWPAIDAMVTADPKDLDIWRKVLIAYASQGWNRQAVDGPLDFFRRREIPSKAKHGTSEPKGFAGIREFMEEQTNEQLKIGG